MLHKVNTLFWLLIDLSFCYHSDSLTYIQRPQTKHLVVMKTNRCIQRLNSRWFLHTEGKLKLVWSCASVFFFLLFQQGTKYAFTCSDFANIYIYSQSHFVFVIQYALYQVYRTSLWSKFEAFMSYTNLIRHLGCQSSNQFLNIQIHI